NIRLVKAQKLAKQRQSRVPDGFCGPGIRLCHPACRLTSYLTPITRKAAGESPLLLLKLRRRFRFGCILRFAVEMDFETNFTLGISVPAGTFDVCNCAGALKHFTTGQRPAELRFPFVANLDHVRKNPVLRRITKITVSAKRYYQLTSHNGSGSVTVPVKIMGLVDLIVCGRLKVIKAPGQSCPGRLAFLRCDVDFKKVLRLDKQPFI